MGARLLFVTLAAALVCALTAAPAHAQRARTFVASYGSDSNPCSFTQPCRTFQQAVNVVAAGGEVTAIDSAGFGPVNIFSQSVVITSPPGIEAGIVANPGSDTIEVAFNNNTVVLRGLTLEGNGTSARGVSVVPLNTGQPNSGQLEIIGCKIRNFTQYGVFFNNPQNVSGTFSILIKDSVITENTFGISLTDSASNLTAALDEVTVFNNGTGVGTGQQVEMQVSNSHVDNNVEGLFLAGTGTVLKNVTLNQSSEPIVLSGSAMLWLSQVTSAIVPGFTNNGGIIAEQGSNPVVFSDGTSHLGPSNVTIGSWALQ